MPPAITSTSLLASAIVLPRSIAASTASSAVGAARRAQHDVDVGMRRDGDEAVAPAAGDRRAAGGAARAQPIDRGAGRHRRDARPVARDLLGEQLGVLAGREADDLQPIGVRVDDRERALADRAGRSENGDALHRLRRSRVLEHDVVDRARRRAARRSDRGRRRGRESAPSCPSRRRCASASTRRDRRRCRARRSTRRGRRAARPASTAATSAPTTANSAVPNTNPPIAPSTVFFGLIAGASGRRPNARPV